MRIMIGPNEIAGIAAGLSSGFERLGVRAEMVLGQPHPFSYGGSPPPAVARLWARLGSRYDRSQSRARPLRILAWLPWRAWSVLVWLWALARYDAFIFLFGRTITGSAIEARLYRMLGKRVVMVYCGSDVRPPYIDGPAVNRFGLSGAARLERLARRISASVRRHERAGFICVNSPFTAQFQTQPFVNWFAMGIPREIEPETADGGGGEAVRIVHSPSDPAAKGTPTIAAIVEKLKREGHKVELVLLQGVSNEAVRAELRRCDFVVDQCWADSPMAAFVTEAAHHGKPAIVAGYAAAEEHGRCFPGAPPPTLFVCPGDLEAAMRRLAADADLRRELGSRARAFVREHWSPEAVARRYLDLLERGPDPAALARRAVYLHGSGLTEERAREAVSAVIDHGGAGALHLGHDPALEQAFAEFAHGGGGEAGTR